ncbi:ModE family transcriptional regulator [Pollutibacter soli]|uniref:winged helix-turn-helix domain-containing protein n=1 Tax=Pollutibacter soli TaxID=3034157 RepID=UPI0030134B04
MAKASISKILKKKSGYKVEGKLWIEFEGEKYFGPGPVELLEKIESTGSLNKAAKEMNMSYKKALKIVNSLNTKSAKPFVILHVGGEEGGGSEITPEAKQMIAYHTSMRKRFADFLKKETDQIKKP